MFRGLSSYWKWNSFWRARHEKCLRADYISLIFAKTCGASTCVTIDNNNSNRFFSRFHDKKVWIFISLVLNRPKKALEMGKCSMVDALIGNEVHFDAPDIKSFCEQIILSFLQSYLCDNINGNRFFFTISRQEVLKFQISGSTKHKIFYFLLFERTARAVRTARIFFKRTAGSVQTARIFFERTARAIRTARIFFERTARAVRTARIFFERTARAVRTARKFFERTARAVRTASQSVRTADKRLPNGYPLGTFLRERLHFIIKKIWQPKCRCA